MMNLLLTVLLISTLMTDSYGCQLYEDKVYGGTFADCSRRNLSRIPDDLPANTTSLDLSRNNIALFNDPQTISPKCLKYLDLSHNSLSSLKNESFQSLQSLQELYLHNNMLTLYHTSFPGDVFQPLKNLRKLHLHNNDQREKGSYPEDALAKLRALEELKIDTFRKTTFGYSFSHMQDLKRFVLGFIGCKLEHIENTTFESFRNISVTSLDLNYCPLYKIEIGSFLSLRHLTTLSMSNTDKLVPTEAMLAMYGFRYSNLSSIKINNIFAVSNFRNINPTKRILSNDVIVYLKDVCVEEFSMSHNQILWIGADVFDNSIFSYCVKYFDMSMNDMYGDSSCFFLLALFPNLVYFNVSCHDKRGSITYKKENTVSNATVGVTLPETLQILDINGFALNDAIMVCDIHIYNATSLRYLSFANVGFSYIKYRVTGLETLKSLDISHNNCSVMSPNFYDDFPNLESLNMANVNFESNYLLNYGKQLFHPMNKLKKVNIYSNNIRLLDVNIFSTNKIEEVVLSHNRLESIPFDLKTTPDLKRLDLSFNSLAVLSDNEMESLDDLAVRHNVTVNLEGNLLSCVCQNLEFILWLHSTNVKMNQGSSYICQMSNGSITNTSYIRDHYEEIWLSCNSEILLSVTVATFSMLLLAIVIMYLRMRHKTSLVNMILRMFGYGPLPQTKGRSDFLNDAYIGYSDADYQYICHTARDHLETTHGLKLFIRDRDSIPGDEIANDIINGIDLSWKTVLYITAAFQNDRWCRFIINRCVYSSARRPHGSIVLVLSVDVRRGDIEPALLNVVEERYIFYMERYRGDDDRLWEDVAKVVKQNFMA